MRRTMWTGLLVAGALLAGIPTLAQGETAGVAVSEPRQAVEARVVIDGKVVGSFSDVSGLSIEVEQVSTVCRKGGGDCDDRAWETAALRAVWKMGSAADELDSSWLTTRAKHDIAMNAIRNIRARVRNLEETLTDPAATMKTKHDTAKNSINNVRMVVAVLTESTANEEGVNQAAMGRLSEAVKLLQPLDADWVLRYRPGRPTYGNITLRGSLGSTSGLMEWYRQVLDGKTDRKSGSIIMADRSGAEVARYNFFEAWPTRYSATLVSEQIEFVVEKVERASK